jgi:septin family protein
LFKVTHSRHYESFRCLKLQGMMENLGTKVDERHIITKEERKERLSMRAQEEDELEVHPLAALEGEVRRGEDRLEELQVRHTLAVGRL